MNRTASIQSLRVNGPAEGHSLEGPHAPLERVGDSDEVPHSPGLHALLPLLLGPLIALATLTIPLAVVLDGSQHAGIETYTAADGPEHTGGFTSSRTGESGGRDSSGKSQ